MSIIILTLMLLGIFLFYQPEVKAQTLDYIVITDVPDGTPMTTVVLPVGGSVTVYASGYNNTGPTYIGLIDCDWFGPGGSWAPTIGGMSTFTAGIVPGLYTQTAANTTDPTINDTFDVEILSPTVDYIIITDCPDGTTLGTGVTLDIGGTVDAYASGYNNTGPMYIGLVECNWSGTGGTWMPSTSGMSTFTAGTVPGLYTQTATSTANPTINSTFIVEILPLTPDYIVITDSPDGTALGTVTLSIGGTVDAYASGYNNTGPTYLGLVECDWSGTGGSWTPTPGGMSTFTAGATGGVYTQTAENTTDPLIFDDFYVDIQNKTLDYIVITDSPDGTPLGTVTLGIGGTVYAYASGYNNTGPTYIGLAECDWYDPGGGGSWASPTGGSNTFTAGATPGLYTQLVENTTDSTINDTFEVDIVPYTLDYIVITGSPNGLPLGTVTLPAVTGTVDAYASGYNNTGPTYIGLAECDWSGTGGSWAFPTGGSNTFTAGATPGLYTQTATNTTDPLILDTFNVNIPSCEDYLVITDAPDGTPLTTVTLPIGGTVTAYASAYNTTGPTYIGLMHCDWSGLGGTWTPSSGATSTFTAGSVPGLYTQMAANETDPTINDTFSVEIIWQIDYIRILDAPNGSGSIVTNRTYTIGDTDVFWAARYNSSGGFIDNSPATTTWLSNDPIVGNVTSPANPTFFDAESAGTCIVTANDSGVINSTGTLTVLPPPPPPTTDYIQIRDAPNGSGSIVTDRPYWVGDTDTFWAARYNLSVDFIGDSPATVTWVSDDPAVGNVSSPDNPTTFSALSDGMCVVTANDDGVANSTGTLTVITPPTLDYIQIRDSPGGLGNIVTDMTYWVGDIDTFWAARYNLSWGFMGNSPATTIWNSSDAMVGSVSSPANPTTFTAIELGTCVVAANDSGVTNTTGTLTVGYLPGYIQIRDGIGGGGNIVNDRTYQAGDIDTFWAARYTASGTFIGDAPVSTVWWSDAPGVGNVSSPNNPTTFEALSAGTCVVTASDGGVTNSTGNLTVNLPSNITVDDDGDALFTTIQEAIIYATDGDTIYVYSGTYFEHLTIDKSITLIGENKDTTVIDGGGYGKVIFVTGDNVNITRFTIQNGEYGIYCYESNSTTITYNIIKEYDYGIYNNRTTDGYIAYNTITDGQYGIVTYEAYNDAVRYNTISYNTEYGAKDYDSQLSGCFNFNYFHHNHIAYWYDPDIPLDTLEFDGNLIEDNEIGIKVENASTISITNNTLTRNIYGIYLIRASPYVADNVITTADYGIYAEHSSPTISNNMISEISQYGIHAKSGDSLRIINNTMTDTEMIFFDSTIKELWSKDSTITKFNTTIEEHHLDDTSSLEDRWFLQIRVVDEERRPIEDAIVVIYDAYDTIVSTHTSDSEGWIQSIPVTESFQNSTSTIVYNPYRIMVLKGSLMNTSTLIIEEDTAVVISLQSKGVVIKPTGPAFPWGLIILIGFIGIISIGGLGIEVMKYGLLSLFLPLYSRIKKEKLLDQPIRYKIHGYIIGNPGAHYGLIKQELGIPNGQLLYHLKRLMQAHLVYSKEDGIRKRFYPVDFPKPKSGEHYLSSIQEKILGIIEKNSGISQKKIASSVNTSRQVASYHLTKMEQKGLIEKEVIGRESKYYASNKHSV